MKVHKEGYKTIFVTLSLAILFSLIALEIFNYTMWAWIAVALFVGFTIFILSFFRVPVRVANGSGTLVSAPADGKVVVIEKVFEPDHFKDERIQVSIFMSPMNVHANWYPVDGVVTRVEHQKGKFHKAWLPKASTENERSLVVIKMEDGREILVRQIAGAMARRIVTYASAGEECFIDQHMGFIKFGSRVDLYLPLDAKINVELEQKTVGNETVIAYLN